MTQVLARVPIVTSNASCPIRLHNNLPWDSTAPLCFAAMSATACKHQPLSASQCRPRSVSECQRVPTSNGQRVAAFSGLPMPASARPPMVSNCQRAMLLHRQDIQEGRARPARPREDCRQIHAYICWCSCPCLCACAYSCPCPSPCPRSSPLRYCSCRSCPIQFVPLLMCMSIPMSMPMPMPQSCPVHQHLPSAETRASLRLH